MWATAKQNILKGEGITLRPSALRTLENLYTTIAATLSREDILRATSEQQESLVREALTRQRTLLIVDNLETVDDDRVLNFIREVPDPTKVIVTTRHRIDVAYSIRLMGMNESEAMEFIVSESNKRQVELTKYEKEQLFRRTGGIPLAITWILSQISFGYTVETLLRRLGQPLNDISKFCFEEVIARIRDRASYELLQTLALFPSDVNREGTWTCCQYTCDRAG